MNQLADYQLAKTILYTPKCIFKTILSLKNALEMRFKLLTSGTLIRSKVVSLLIIMPKSKVQSEGYFCLTLIQYVAKIDQLSISFLKKDAEIFDD